MLQKGCNIMKSQITVDISKLPFRSGKKNISPDHPKCLACGKCCTSYEGIPLLPEDFIGDDLEAELRVLKDMGLLYIQCRFNSFDVFLNCADNNNVCHLLSEHGCMLPADMRPAGCRYFSPVTGEKGLKRANTREGCISKLDKKIDMWTWREEREPIISKLLKELDDAHKGYCW